MVKTGINKDSFHWLESVDDNLNTKPKDFRKYVCKLQKNYHTVIILKIGENVIT
jgi:hypothetical protein